MIRLKEIRRKPGTMTEVVLTRDVGDWGLIEAWPPGDNLVCSCGAWQSPDYLTGRLDGWTPDQWAKCAYGPLPRKGSKQWVLLEL